VIQFTNQLTICTGESHTEGSSVYNETGVYTNVYTSSLGCDSIVTTNLTVTDMTSLFTDNELEFCPNESVELDLSQYADNFTIEWSTGETSPVISIDQSGTYTATVSSEACSITDNIFVQEFESYVPSVLSYEFCLGNTLELNIPEQAGFVTWDDGSNDFVYSAQDSETTTVMIEDACGIGMHTFVLSRVNCDCIVYVPSAFTPDQDGTNEAWGIDYDCGFIEFNLEVYNRWGKLVFQTNDPDEKWQGEVRGQDYFAPVDVYSFILRYTSVNELGTSEIDGRTGTITLIR